jgi:selenocysteine lyase/cysteine desulfurase
VLQTARPAAPPRFDPAAFRAHFPALPRYAWLNTQGVPPGAKPVLAAVRAAMDAWTDGSFDWTAWEADAERARAICTRWLGAAPGSVAVVATLADAAATVAHVIAGLVRTGQPRPHVVVPAVEFRSNLFPWLALAERGCDVTAIEPDADGLVRTEALIAATTPGVALLAVSEVQSATGHRIDVRAIAAHCRAVGARSFFNLTQSLGVLPFDVAAVEPDFVAAHSYKWLLAPRGATVLYVHPDRWRELRPLAPNWKNAGDLFGAPGESAPAVAGETPHYVELYNGPYSLFDDARRADASLAWFSWAGARAALELLDTLSPHAVATHCTALAADFRHGARALGHRVVARELPSQLAAVEFANPADAGAASKALLTAGVVTSARGARLRFGFHAFNDASDVERALTALRRTTR